MWHFVCINTKGWDFLLKIMLYDSHSLWFIILIDSFASWFFHASYNCLSSLASSYSFEMYLVSILSLSFSLPHLNTNFCYLLSGKSLSFQAVTHWELRISVWIFCIFNAVEYQCIDISQYMHEVTLILLHKSDVSVGTLC